MRVVIDIPNDFTGDYIADKFKDFFSRIIADIDCNGMCGKYEKEIAEMFLKAFDESKEKGFCNCRRNSKLKDNEPCCRCDSRQTNADRIRRMTDEELAEWINTKNTWEQCACEESACMKKLRVNGILRWLRSEAE